MRGYILSCLAVAFLFVARPAFAGPPDYDSQIRPLLQKQCYECHDSRKKRSDLRLDQKAAAFRGGESGKPGIVAGKSKDSEIIRRVLSTDPDKVMPPKGEKFSAEQIQLLRTWIDSGAVWPEGKTDNRKHWAFQAPVRPPVPKNDAWARNPIDRFVLDRLHKEGLKPSPEVDKVTLLRRLSLDLIGLPPTPEEVDAFLADKSDLAYEKQVDRLLASPHYGERWGRLWLDAARYADSDGFEKDKPRFVWFYRDWVINALNRDLPYDQFIIDQIAGDLMPKPTQDQLVATGFLRNSMINEEGGVDPEQFRMEAMFDRMDAIGKGILGLTIQCAQCHNHKFDPISQLDYYRMFAYLNSSYEANPVVYTPEALQKWADLSRQIRNIEASLKHKMPGWEQKMAEWEANVRQDQPAWQIVRPSIDASGDQKHYLLDNGSILAAGYAPTKHTKDFTVTTDRKKITAVRLELLNHPDLPAGGPGRSITGLFALTEFRVQAAPAGRPSEAKDVKIIRATADVNPPVKPLDAIFDDKSNRKRITGPVEFAIDGKNETAWTIDIGPGRSNVPRKAVFVFEKPIEFENGAVITFKLTQDHGGWNSDDNQNNNLGCFRFAITDQPDAVADPLPVSIRELLIIPPARRSPAQMDAVFSYWRTTVPEWHEANEKIEELWKQHPKGETQLVLAEREKRRDTHLLKRGDFLKPGEAVLPGVPSFLHPLPADAQPDRLTFARWLANRRSPTTARSLVNRIWQAYFGFGFVTSSEDLGTQCEPPSNQALLDWLAVEFMEAGWSQKKLHRLIATSATYRQSSKVTPELLQSDPDNRLLARGVRLRVDAESVRDVALAASGLLTPKVGGRSVFPPLPAFMLQPPVSYGPKAWPEDKDENRYRRALYTFRYRSLPYPALQTFDAPNGDVSCVRRVRSNTPLQALMTLNEPLFVECSKALAWKTILDAGSKDEDRLTFAFRRCLSRLPTDSERKVLMDLLERQRKHFAKPDAKPLPVAFMDPAKHPKLPEGVTTAEVASWAIVCRVLLNLDETISKE